VCGVIEPWLGDPQAGDTARQVLLVWSEVTRRSQAALQRYRQGAPAAQSTAAINGACDRVAATGPAKAAYTLACAVETSPYRMPYDAWSAVRHAWSLARGQGRTPRPGPRGRAGLCRPPVGRCPGP
jgi:hypothetical protein